MYSSWTTNPKLKAGFPVYKCLLCEAEKEGSQERLVIGSEELTENEIRAAPQENDSFADFVYLDHNATTPVDPAVKEALAEAFDIYGNPSSIHGQGIAAGKILDEARRKTAVALGCTIRRVIFTGGGSEAANLAIKGAAACCTSGRNQFITSAIEHPAVLNTFKWLEGRGYEVTYLGLTKQDG